MSDGSTVVTVHGLWMHGLSMTVLGRRLRAREFSVRAFSYPSVSGSLTANAAALGEFLDAVTASTVHLVAHSLGGAVIAKMLERRVPERLGRVVLLGSPLRGSQTATRVARLPGGRWFIGKSMQELNACGGLAAWNSRVEAGVVAGDLPLGVGRLVGRFGEPNDGTVAVAETRLDGLRDHIVLPISHFALLWSGAVVEEIEQFLLHGRFRHTRASS